MTFISKEDSKCLYGIAIFLMIFHHLFCSPSKLLYEYTTLFVDKEQLTRIAYFGKMCVGIYTFVSGYAFAKIKQNKNELNLKERVNALGKQLFGFLSKYWLCCLIFIPMGILMDKISPAIKDTITTIIIGGNTINGEWWYVTQYIVYLLTLPFVLIYN